MLLLVFTSSADAGSCSATPGGYAVVEVEKLVLRDVGRAREIPLRIYSPLGGGRRPVIIFSHGTGLSKDEYSYFAKFMASHGFVCIHPTHVGSDESIFELDKPFFDPVNLKALGKAADNIETWMNRALDVRFIIDSLWMLDLNVDSTRIALAGHSLGAWTVLMVAGAPAMLPSGRETLLRDSRIKAFIAMSPPGAGKAFGSSAWQGLTRPTLLITGSEDYGPGRPPSWRLEPFTGMPPGDKFLLFINGAKHISFVDPYADAPEDPEIRNLVKATSLAFLEAYLLNKKDGRRYLTLDQPSKQTQGRASVRAK